MQILAPNRALRVHFWPSSYCTYHSFINANTITLMLCTFTFFSSDQTCWSQDVDCYYGEFVAAGLGLRALSESQ